MTAGTHNDRMTFDWVEYAVFTTSLLCSVAIGIYYGFIAKEGQNTVEGYVLGGKKMSLYPVSLSLTSSFISGITLLGAPAEVYVYGLQYVMSIFAMVIVAFVIITFFLPVFYELQLISLYEYLELRFDRKMRKCVSMLFVIFQLAYIPIVIYVPALAMNQVTGVNIHLITPIVCLICIFYTALGGLKAVVLADTVQTIMMTTAVLVIVYLGLVDVGGISKVHEAAANGDRLTLFNMDPNPTIRLTFWTAIVGYSVFWTGALGVAPSTVQRFVSLPTERKARASAIWLAIGGNFFTMIASLTGLIMFAKYQGCDPTAANLIKKPDQIVPYFVLDIAGHIRGLPGLFISGVFAAALSTMSTGVNTISATLYEDFVLPCLKTEPSDATSSLTMKWMSFGFGILCVGLVSFVERLGAVVEVAVSFCGGTNGVILGVFVLGTFCHRANTKGCFWGVGAGVLTLAWIITGNRYYQMEGLINYPIKPIRTDLCPTNMTNFRNWAPIQTENDVWPMYKISGFNFSLIGFLVTITVGYVSSLLTGSNNGREIDPKLFTPCIRKYLPPIRKELNGKNVTSYVSVPLKDLEGK